MDLIPAERQDGQPTVDAAGLPDDVLVLDVRDRADFLAGHAPGAVNVPLSRLPGRLTDLPAAPDGPLLVSCGGGSKQTRAVAFLRANGVDAAVLGGGMRGWRSSGRPMVGGPVAAADRDPTVDPPT